jgi:hypothetical protein
MFGAPKKTEPGTAASRWSYFQVGLALLAVALVYIFFSRWWENRRIDRAAQEKQDAVRAEADRRAVEMMGGNRFEILAFYSVPGAIRRGESSQLCYGVSNAKAVRIEPFADALRPSYSRCVSVAPRKTTTYTFTAEDAEGHSKTATTEVQVR